MHKDLQIVKLHTVKLWRLMILESFNLEFFLLDNVFDSIEILWTMT